MPFFEVVISHVLKEGLNFFHCCLQCPFGTVIVIDDAFSGFFEEQGVLRLPEGILFGTGEFKFDKDSQAEKTAKSIARALNLVLPCSVLDREGKRFREKEACLKSYYHNKNGGFVQSIYVNLLEMNVYNLNRNIIQKYVINLEIIMVFFALIEKGN